MFACGRYEGIDQRVVDSYAERMPVDEVSIGDYVLVGGEVAVLVMVEAVVLLPGTSLRRLAFIPPSIARCLCRASCGARAEG